MMTIGPTSLKPRQKKRKYGPVHIMMAMARLSSTSIRQKILTGMATWKTAIVSQENWKMTIGKLESGKTEIGSKEN